jgi:hypothetical protein
MCKFRGTPKYVTSMCELCRVPLCMAKDRKGDAEGTVSCFRQFHTLKVLPGPAVEGKRTGRPRRGVEIVPTAPSAPAGQAAPGQQIATQPVPTAPSAPAPAAAAAATAAAAAPAAAPVGSGAAPVVHPLPSVTIMSSLAAK